LASALRANAQSSKACSLMIDTPRITLISALAQSLAPAEAAMAEVWPLARPTHLLDDSLAPDLAALGAITPSITERFVRLGRYAAEASDGVHRTRGILFTCSAFRPSIDVVKADLQIPVISPNEAAFEEALAICTGRPDGGRIGLVLTFQGSLPPLRDELAALAQAQGHPAPDLVPVVAEGALAALKGGDAARHDQLIVNAACRLPRTDAIVIGQFSMARAAAAVAAARGEPVLTTPHAAARKLKALVEQGPLR
jgi:Asp/Glu/hydantoin racemase